ncbi:hypothetical protein [Clostridium cadaveris]|uniref:hypothetical protein n=1 Tax=Clostridium cadaveris TaxID=1529 RepID=UPI00041E0A73|nr:hypothetical protein [Clostridium cadaveris]
MNVVIFLLIVALIIASFQWFSYYCSVRGLLYYLAIKHDDMPNESKMKELTEMAIKRTIKEFFGLN